LPSKQGSEKSRWLAEELIQAEPWPIARHVYVIAEIGINHNGDLEIVRQLIDLAKSAGCDAVKFQKRTIDIVYAPDVLAAPRESPWGTTTRHQKEALELDEKAYNDIDAHCREVGIDWFASAWDVDSQRFLRKYDLPYNKIASPMVTHNDLLECVAGERKPTFLSTGMSTWEEIDHAVEVFDKHGCPIVLMHSVSEYPAHEEHLNLSVIGELRRRYGRPVGYSGHEATMVPSVIAAAMGAVAIERHITLDRAMYGSDQSASLEKRGLEMMVGYIRTIPIVLGDGQKTISEAELKNAGKLRYWGPSFQAPTTR
jgi:N-acetylneuraminate synthase